MFRYIYIHNAICIYTNIVTQRYTHKILQHANMNKTIGN